MKKVSRSAGRRKAVASGLAAVLALALPRVAKAEGVPAIGITGPNGSQSVLLGTMHLGHRGVIQPSGRIFDGAKRLVVESQKTDPGVGSVQGSLASIMDPTVFERLRQTGQLTPAPWTSALNTKERETLLARVACREGQGVTQVVLSARPWLADAAATPCPHPGVRSRDDTLLDEARQRGIPIVSLDIQSEVQPLREALRTGISDETYVLSLKRSLSEEGQREIETYVRGLNTGDYDAIRDAALQHVPDPRIAAFAEQNMICRRNALWIPRLTPLLQEGSAVVMVGAAHLPGPCGLITLLRQAGFRVAPVTLQPAG